MTYESWRITFQSSEQAARSAYTDVERLAREVAELRRGYERYETARRMNPRAWKEAWELNIKTGKPFDEIIDDLRQFVRPK